MGIEAALVAWGMSASAAATTVGALGAAAAGVAGAAATKALGPKPPGVPDPIKPPQQSVAPDRGGFLAGNSGAGRLGNASTFLTGAGGIDSSVLNLGRNTLLGQ